MQRRIFQLFKKYNSIGRGWSEWSTEKHFILCNLIFLILFSCFVFGGGGWNDLGKRRGQGGGWRGGGGGGAGCGGSRAHPLFDWNEVCYRWRVSTVYSSRISPHSALLHYRLADELSQRSKTKEIREIMTWRLNSIPNTYSFIMVLSAWFLIWHEL